MKTAHATQALAAKWAKGWHLLQPGLAVAGGRAQPPGAVGTLGTDAGPWEGKGRGAPAAQTEQGWGALVPHSCCHSRWEMSSNSVMLCRVRFGYQQVTVTSLAGVMAMEQEQLLLCPPAETPFPRAGIPVSRRDSRDRDTFVSSRSDLIILKSLQWLLIAQEGPVSGDISGDSGSQCDSRPLSTLGGVSCFHLGHSIPGDEIHTEPSPGPAPAAHAGSS